MGRAAVIERLGEPRIVVAPLFAILLLIRGWTSSSANQQDTRATSKLELPLQLPAPLTGNIA